MKRRIISLVLAAIMLLTLMSGSLSSVSAATSGDTHTFNSYVLSLPESWNPHTWESSDQSGMIYYMETPLVNAAVKNSATGEYQWIFLAATDIVDVTASHQDDLVRYGCSEFSASFGYVYEIRLNPEMCWEDGTPINADTYIYSMERLLNPDLQNRCASFYHSSAAAIAGAYNYHYQGLPTSTEVSSMDDLVETADGSYTTADGIPVYVALNAPLSWLGNNTLADYVEAYGSAFFDMDAYDALRAIADEDGFVILTAESFALLTALISVPAWGEGPGCEVYYLVSREVCPEASFDSVGLYKVDDYTIRYVCQNYISYAEFLSYMTSNWLVYEDLYEAGNYATSVATTMSYGPYRLQSYNSDGFTFTRNEKHFEYDVASNGKITSTTSFLVDGAYIPQWETDVFHFSVMPYAIDLRNAFMAGELDLWVPTAEELTSYTASDRLYAAEESYTGRLFFNTNVDALKNMDAYHGNTNSVVLSNDSFRKAFSLAIDRSELAKLTPGYTESFTLLNDLYFYDVFNDPNSVYRNASQAKAAICDLYGVPYTSTTLDQAYASITGYDLAAARKLMAQACDELVAAGLYVKGEPIVIQVGWASGLMTDAQIRQNDQLTQYLNIAAQGSGFGTIQLKATGNSNRYIDVPDGRLAIGYGAWGGGAFDPFNMMQVYCNPDYTSVHEVGCYDPRTETLTLVINGTSYTMTWQEWSASMTSGRFAYADTTTKLQVLSKLEAAFLDQYYCIPLYSMTTCSMLSQKVDYYTKNYSSMYGFGGDRFLQYNYTDAEWDAYVASGKLKYPTNSELHTHTYHSFIVAPTCTRQGYTNHSCTCGDSYQDSYTQPIGHNFVGTICRNCGQIQVLEGENTLWTPDAEEVPAIRINAQPEELLNVYLNGELVDPANYTVTYGSTIITFKQEFLATLPEGDHTVSVEFTVGTAEATLTVAPEGTVPEDPDTPEDDADRELGDADGDGKIDAADAHCVIMYYSEMWDLAEEQLWAADVNGDGKVDTADAYYILLFHNNMIDAFPVGN